MWTKSAGGCRCCSPGPAWRSPMEVLEERVDGRVRELRLRSPAMGRTVTATLLTPSGWRPGDHGSHPVLYLLHGSSDNHHCWLRHTNLAELAARTNFLVV